MEPPGQKRAFYLGRYNCIDPLGEGPLGETFRAKIYGVAGFEKQFAVKRLHARLCADEEFVARFVNAATAYAGLDHERIARVHEVNVQGSQYYVAIDLVRGIDLQKLLELLRARGEAIPTDVALLIGLDLADALAYAHARRDLLPGGVLHLGLSPASVMVTHEGDLRLLDVGLMHALIRLGWADDDQLLPVLGYLPPEQLRADPVDGRADVFALGALIHELISGARAFPGETAREVRSRIEAAPPRPPATDARLAALLTDAMQPDPQARLASIAVMREAMVPMLAARAHRARTDLGALVRRLARPERKTGAFPVVAMPTSVPAPVAPKPANVGTDRSWAPPNASKAPPAPTHAPATPIGPQLSSDPPRNTYAGVGADDQVLVPIELVELPGTPTERAMPVVTQTLDDALTTRHEKDDAPTRPIEKVASDAITTERATTPAATPRTNGSGLYSGGNAPSDTMPMISGPTVNVPRPPMAIFTTLPSPPPPFPVMPPPLPTPAVPPPSSDEPPPLSSLIPDTITVTAEPEGPGERTTTATDVSPYGATVEVPLGATGPLPALVPENRPPAGRSAAQSFGPGAFIPPPLTLPPLPSPGRTWKLAGIGVGVALVLSAGIYFGFVHGTHPPAPANLGQAEATPNPASPSPDEPRPTPPATAATPSPAAPTAAATGTPAPAPTEPAAGEPAPAVAHPTPPQPNAAAQPAAAAPTVAQAAPTHDAPAEPAVAKPAAAGVGSGAASPNNVEVFSEPTGGDVYIDGEKRGQTPLRLSLPMGKHKLVVVKDGMKLRKENLPVDGAATQLNLTLEAATLPEGVGGPAGLKVRCKTQGELRILIDGADSGRTCPNEERISVAVGNHRVGLYSPRTDQTVEVQADVAADADHSTRVHVKY